MAARGQRTQIILGSLRADISLVNASGDPSAVRFETARIDRDGNVVTDVESVETDGPLLLGEPDPRDEHTQALDAIERLEANREAAPAEPDVDPASLIPDRQGMAPIIPQNTEQALQRDAHHGLTEPATRVVKGATGPDGFVDLSARLSEIDAHVKLDGMEIVAAVPSNYVPRERVRNASFVVPQDPTSQKIVGLLYGSLLETSRVVAVRWTKRTNQALGVLVASKSRGCLMLYEVEWGANERKAPAAAKVDGVVENLSDGERQAAIAYVDRISRPASALDEVADERRELQRALLDATKAGEQFALPERGREDDDLAAAIAVQS